MSMCGIAGKVYASYGRPVESEVLARMRQSLVHRGPDDEGEYRRGNVGLSFRRLSIIDVDGGHQPILNEDESLAVIFNGEIYNHKSLRAELESHGHRFRTRTDTEVILHGYEQWGTDVCKHLHGMFAFAIVKPSDGSLFMARDRIGKKPLFYAVVDQGTNNEAIIFASELKSLLAEPRLRREIDLISLNHYLSVQYVPAEMCIFKQGRKLLPGHWLKYRQGTLITEQYWHLQYEPKRQMTEQQAAEQAEHLIDEAVKMRLESEVPLGCFLSGGVDSSLVVAFMRRHVTGNLNTFSIGFGEKDHNELPYAREVAQKFDTNHNEFIVEPNALEALGTMAWHFDEPMADSSGIPTYYLAKMTKQHVSVALNGDGGDESFGGYARYLGVPLLAKLAATPAALRHLAAPMLSVGGAFLPNNARIEMLKYANRITLDGPEKTYMASMVFFRDYMKRELFAKVHHKSIFGEGCAWDTDQITIDRMRDGTAKEWIDKMIYSDVTTYLPGALLPKVDRMLSACSLEGRAPLLDQNVMEFAARLPVNLKIPNGHLKHILKTIARPIFGDAFLERPKQGFGVPIGDWFRGPLKELTHEFLLSKTALDRGYFNPKYVQRIYNEHTTGRMNHQHRIWALIMFEAWNRTFIDQPDPLANGPINLL